MINTDCKYFPGDRPCEHHKANQETCAACRVYQPRGKAILMIKFEALGDVLRTTSILPSLHKAYGNCFVTWITSQPARDLFVGNPMVDEVLCRTSEYLPAILSREFDVVINPDGAPRSCELAAITKAPAKYGFVAGSRGKAVPLNPAAEEWLVMSGDDQAKKANTKTYQQILHAMCELDDNGQHIVLNLTDEEDLQDGALMRSLDLDPCKPVVGINTGAGSRWKHKKWTVAGYIELIEMMRSSTDASVLLLGGPAERERNEHIASFFGSSAVVAPSNTVREFIRLVNLCDLVVTGDTLALHIALGLRKRVVALFGPTSHQEIDLYGLGHKVVAPLDCVCCYRADCEREPTCMDLIKAEEVMAAVVRELGVAVHAGAAT
jgi:ADP-heptose:LPS heptosyltransferase